MSVEDDIKRCLDHVTRVFVNLDEMGKTIAAHAVMHDMNDRRMTAIEARHDTCVLTMTDKVDKLHAAVTTHMENEERQLKGWMVKAIGLLLIVVFGLVGYIWKTHAG